MHRDQVARRVVDEDDQRAARTKLLEPVIRMSVPKLEHLFLAPLFRFVESDPYLNVADRLPRPRLRLVRLIFRPPGREQNRGRSHVIAV